MMILFEIYIAVYIAQEDNHALALNDDILKIQFKEILGSILWLLNDKLENNKPKNNRNKLLA